VAADAEPQLLRHIFGRPLLRPAEGVQEGRLAKPVRQPGDGPACLRVDRPFGFDAGGRGRSGRLAVARIAIRSKASISSTDARGAPGGLPRVPRPQGDDDMPAGIQR
jgi:hypothetical protein